MAYIYIVYHSTICRGRRTSTDAHGEQVSRNQEEQLSTTSYVQNRYSGHANSRCMAEGQGVRFGDLHAYAWCLPLLVTDWPWDNSWTNAGLRLLRAMTFLLRNVTVRRALRVL